MSVRYLSLPDGEDGLTNTTTATPWSSPWIEVTTGLLFPIYVTAIQFSITLNNAGTDLTREGLVQIGKGASGSETVVVMMPFQYRSDTIAYGHTLERKVIYLPEPVLIPANTRITVRVLHNLATAVTYDGIKIFYVESTPPSVVLNSPVNGVTVSATPTLEFTGTDVEGEDIRYQVQINNTSSFPSPSFYPRDWVSTSNSSTLVTTIDTTPGDVTKLLVGISAFSTGNPRHPTNVVFGTTQLTQITSASITASSGESVSWWYLDNPTAKVDSLRAIFSATMANITMVCMRMQNTASGYHQATTAAMPVNATVHTISVNNTIPDCLNFSLGNAIDRAFEWAHYRQEVLVTDFSNFVILSWTNEENSSIPPATHKYYVSANGGASILGMVSVAPLSPTVNAISGTNPGFSNTVTSSDTDPFNSGEKIAYTVQSALGSGTYYWRVRGNDPSGSKRWGPWSEVRSFDVSAGTTYTVSMPVTEVSIPSISKVIIFSQLLSIVEVSVTTLSRVMSYFRTLAVTEVSVTSILKGLFKTLSVTEVSIPSLQKITTYLRSLLVTEVSFPTLAAVKLRLLSLSAIVTSIPSLISLITYAKLLSVVETSTVTLNRVVSYLRSLVVTSVTVPVLNRIVTYFRSLAVTEVSIAVLSKIVTYVRSLGVISVTIPTLSRIVTYVKSLSVTEVSITVLAKIVTYVRNLGVVSTTIPTLSRIVTYLKNLTVTEVSITVLQAIKLRLVNLATVSVSVVSLTANLIGGVVEAIRRMLLRVGK